MAFLNTQERQALLDELKNMNFNQAKWKLQHLDPKGRLAFYRNAQGVNRWMTRYVLQGLGTRVTLVEANNVNEKNGKFKSDFKLVEVIVEPTPENRL
jgi:hypothetical protein